jgi:hypothetical protein
VTESTAPAVNPHKDPTMLMSRSVITLLREREDWELLLADRSLLSAAEPSWGNTGFNIDPLCLPVVR